jgi:hypothetical protein
MGDEKEPLTSETELIAHSPSLVRQGSSARKKERASLAFSGPAENEGDDTMWTWDYVLVFKILKPGTMKGKKDMYNIYRSKTAEYERKIQDAGLKTTSFLSVQEDELYILVGATEKRLRWEADRRDYDLPLDVDQVIEQGATSGMRLALAAKSDQATDKLVQKDHWRQLYGKYDRNNKQHPERHRLYKKPPADEGHHPGSLFRAIDRLRLTLLILGEDAELHGAGLKLDDDLHRGSKGKHPLSAVFPAHEAKKKQELEQTWMSWWPPLSQPIPEIRDYFGEKIAFYFSFLETYCKALIVPSFIGLVFFIWQRSVGRVDIEVLPFFGVAMAVWATLFLEVWKRKQAALCSDWGMHNYEDKEGIRAEYFGDRVRDPTSGKMTKIFPAIWAIFRAFISQVVVWSLICVVLAAVVSIFILRKTLRASVGVVAGNLITAIIQAIQIQILNYVYSLVSEKLNDYENHRTSSEFENSLIVKSFLFKFINSYNSLFYIAFFKKMDSSDAGSGCPSEDPNCLTELQTQLGILFGTALVVNNTLEIVIPFIKTKVAERMNRAAPSTDGSAEKERSQWEKEYELLPYTTFDDFDEMVVQYGYVTLFVVAFPLSPLCALINNYVEIRLDAKKILTLSQRPKPLGAVGIGTWLSILNVLSFISIITNTIIVVFNTEIVNRWADYSVFTLAWVFFIIEHIIGVVKMIISYAVEDVPEDVREHLERQQHIVDVLINDIPEEEEELLHAEEMDQTIVDSWSYDSVSKKAPSSRNPLEEAKSPV